MMAVLAGRLLVITEPILGAVKGVKVKLLMVWKRLRRARPAGESHINRAAPGIRGQINREGRAVRGERGRIRHRNRQGLPVKY